MIPKRAQLLSSSPLRRARLIAAFLLACLTWSATAELNHHHGLRSITGSKQQLTQADVSFETTESTAQIQSSDQQSSSSKSKTATDCTICQLHQNLSATLFSHPPRLGPEEISLPRPSITVVAELSAFAPNQRGRAPPSIL